jgi:hypothetical protein
MEPTKKVRRDITIDQDIDDLLRKSEGINASGLVNTLLRKHLKLEPPKTHLLIMAIIRKGAKSALPKNMNQHRGQEVTI